MQSGTRGEGLHFAHRGHDDEMRRTLHNDKKKKKTPSGMSDSPPPPPPPVPPPPPPPSSSSTLSSSLDLLNPRPWASRKRAWSSDTAKHIESISRQAITAASNRDWHNAVLQKHIDADYAAELDHAEGVPLTRWDDYVRHHERLATANPDYRFHVLDSVSDVYEKQGTAECFLLLRVTGHPVNVVRESVIVMYWKRKDDCWRCSGQRVVRGMFWNA